MEIITAKTTAVTRENEAVSLHYEIMRNGADAATAMVNLAANLKAMRDKHLYEELGYESFEEYTVEAVGLKKTQAYDYISAYEQLGAESMAQTAGLGITKVKLLCAFSPAQRAEFLESSNPADMTVKELKERIDDLTRQGEQLALDLEAKADVSEQLEDEKAELERKLKEALSRPVEVAVRELTDEEKKALVAEAVEEATKKQKERIKSLEAKNAEAKDALEIEKKKSASAAKKAVEEAAEKMKAEREKLTRAASSAETKVTELEKQLKLSASPEILRFSFYFEAVQENMKMLIDTLGQIPDIEKADKLRQNLAKYADALKEMVKT